MAWAPTAALTLAAAVLIVGLASVGVALMVRLLLWLDTRGAFGAEADPGGGTGPVSRPSEPSDGGGEPAWWPRFEREFQTWAAAQASGAVAFGQPLRSDGSREGQLAA